MGFGDIRKKKFVEKEEDFKIPFIEKKFQPRIPSGVFVENENEIEDEDEYDEEIPDIHSNLVRVKTTVDGISEESESDLSIIIPILIVSAILITIYFIITRGILF